MRVRGFTLIEVSVVVLVLVLLAAAVAPNLVASEKAREARLASVEVRDLFRQARETAVRDGRTTAIRFDDGARTLNLVRLSDPVAAEVSPNTEGLQSEDASEGQDPVVQRVRLPDGVQMQTLEIDGQTRATADWEVRFYPDGSATRGGIELESAGLLTHLAVDRRGEVSMGEGELPEAVSPSWPAGEYERRT